MQQQGTVQQQAIALPAGTTAIAVEANGARVVVVYREAINLALTHNGVSPIVSVRVEAAATSAIEAIELSIEPLALGTETVAAPLRIPIGALEAGQILDVPSNQLKWHLNPAVFLALEEAATTTLTVSVDGRAVTDSIRILSADEWWARGIPESLAAFVRPNSAAITELLTEVSGTLQRRTGNPSLEGYFAGPERAHRIVEAIYDAVAARGIAYVTAPASFEGTGQRIRSHEDVLASKQGNCLDLACLFAAAMEQAGIHPILAVMRAHAFVGYLTDDEQLPSVVIDDRARIVTLADSNLFDAFECTAACRQEPFDVARTVVRSAWRRDLDEVAHLIDVRAAHNRIKPLPTIRWDGLTRVIEVVTPGAAAAERRIPLGTARQQTGFEAPPRIQRWQRALLDMTYRNALLKLKAASSLAIHVPAETLSRFEDEIAAGTPFHLHPHDQLADIHVAQGARTAADIDAQDLGAILLGDRAAFVAVKSSEYQNRMRSLARRAKTALEETGTSSLYLALGTLEWEERSQQGKAPLFLVPVTLTGGRGSTPFRIQIDETRDLEPNYCLIEKLRTSWGINIPELREPGADEAGIDLTTALEAIRAAILRSKVVSFHVEETAHLALLQFSTLQLWQDLTHNWKTFIARPGVHHLVGSTAGSFDDGVSVPPPTGTDEATVYLPVPADGSQLEAIRWASAGKTFVLEGPPGTGKSQTITNLVANCLAEGKTVLFVAEKGAALDIVKSRLNDVGLDPFTLDLHGQNQTVTSVREQLQQALDLDLAPSAAYDELRRTYRGVVSGLARYPQQLHESGPSGLSAWDARQVCLELDSAAEELDGIEIPREAITDGTPVSQWSDAAAHLEESLLDLGHPPMQSPWRLAGPIDFGVLNRSRLQLAMHQVAAAVKTIDDPDMIKLLEPCKTPEQLDGLAAWLDAGWAYARPTGDAAAIVTPQWQYEADRLKYWVQQFRDHFTPALRTFDAIVVDLDLDGLLQRSVAADDKLFFKNKRRREIMEGLQPALIGPPNFTLEQLTVVLRDLVAIRDGLKKLRAEASNVDGVVVPPGWNPLDPRQATYADSLIAGIQRSALLHSLTAGAIAAVSGDVLARRSEALSKGPQVAELARSLREFYEMLQPEPIDIDFWLGSRSLLAAFPEDLPKWLADVPGGFVRLGRWSRVRSGLAATAGLGLDAGVRSGEITGSDLELRVRIGLAKAVLHERFDVSGLAGFDHIDRQRQTDRFIRTGSTVRSRMVTELPARLVQQRTFDSRGTIGRVGELRRQLGRRRGGLTIRQLLHRFSDIITQVTPCFLMSPASVARFLPADMVFDVVVFDEASQIRVPQAVCAMGRGKSVIVVGDSKQMPPTSVFANSVEEEESLETADGLPVPVDLDSILSEAVESGFPQLLLSWHYRSRDESLIAFSNQYYYDGRLSSFPMPPDRVGNGLRLVRVDGVWERSAARVNRGEAMAVVAEVRRLLAEDVRRSIGVVTFNSQQQTLVLDLLEADGDPLIAAAFDRDDEPLFVKNLENVQGDERDVILFTLAFSKDEKGRVPLNWGPLTRAGGERRLNVAVTRAKRQVVIFSSFAPHELDLGNSTSKGLSDLKDYLLLASGSAPRAVLKRQRPVDLHVEEIVRRLVDAGLEVQTRVGLSDFTVDLAVRADGQPWIAVMLDGPEWAQRGTVGDREALPSAVLTGAMGWPKVVRIWLPTWLQDSDGVVASVVEAASTAPVPAVEIPAVEAAVEDAPAVEPVVAAPVNVFVAADDSPIYAFDGLDDRASVAAEALKVTAEEGPILVERLVRILAARFGLSRVVAGRQQQIRGFFPAGLLVKAPNTDLVAWPPGTDPATYTGYRTGKRDVEDVPYHELRNALIDAVRRAHGLSREDAMRETARAFDAVRLTTKSRPRLEKVMMAAQREGLIEDQDGIVVLR